MKFTVKPIGPVLLALCIALFGAWLTWRSGACFEDVGPWWKGRVMDRYVSTQGKVDRVYVNTLREPKRQSIVGREIRLEGTFAANGNSYNFSGIDSVLYNGSDAKAAATVEEIRRSRTATEVLYDPESPQHHVLHRENLPGVFKVVFMGFLGLIIFVTGLGLVALSGKFILGQVLTTSVQLLKPTPPLSSDPKEDYYSGALASLARERWTGDWCEIFLMPDRRIVIVHDESTYHRVEAWPLRDILAGKVVVPFPEDEPDAYQKFLHRIREEA